MTPAESFATVAVVLLASGVVAYLIAKGMHLIDRTLGEDWPWDVLASKTFGVVGYGHSYSHEVIRRGRDVLGDLDLTVLSDLYPDPDCPDCENHNGHMGHGGYYIGWPEELGAGLRGGSVECAPQPFATIESAYAWAAQHEDELRDEAE